MASPRTLFLYRSRALPLLPALFALLLVLLTTLPALAVEPPTLDGAITDRSGVLGDETEVRDALARLYTETGTQLYVVLLPTTDGEDINEFIGRVADRNADLFTTKDALLLIATDDRRMSIVTGEALDDLVDQNELDRVRTEWIRPRLANNDWSGGAAAAALGLLDAIKGSTPTPQAGGSGGVPILLIGGIIALGAIGVFLWSLWNRSKTNRTEAAAQEELGQRASSLLVSTDEVLRKAEQEIGFAEAQFGSAEAGKLAQALQAAKAELNAAFKISTDLDDETPETPEQRRAMLEEIIKRCESANAGVAAQQSQIDALRDLGRNVEQVLPQIEARIAATDQKVEAGREAIRGFEAYARESWAAVATNAEEAARRMDTARASVQAARASVAAGKRDDAATRARAAESALAEADTLLAAIDETARSLGEMRARLAAALAQEHADLAKAEQAVASGRAKGREQQLADAKARLADAQRLSTATPPDVANASRLVTEADALLDQVTADAERAAQSAQSAIALAATSIAQARALVNGGQGGRRAMSRVNEAEGYLQRANELLAVDAVAATQAAQTADALADEAVAEAHAGGGGSSVGWGGFAAPPARGGGGGGVGDLLVGVLLGNMLGGGSNRGGGWGGSGSGWSGGFGSGGFGGGRSGGGSRSGGGGSRGGGLGGGRSSGGGMGGGRRSSGGF